MDSENKAMAKHRPSSGAELVTAVVDCSVESDQVPEIRKFLLLCRSLRNSKFRKGSDQLNHPEQFMPSDDRYSFQNS